ASLSFHRGNGNRSASRIPFLREDDYVSARNPLHYRGFCLRPNCRNGATTGGEGAYASIGKCPELSLLHSSGTVGIGAVSHVRNHDDPGSCNYGSSMDRRAAGGAAF